MTGVCVCVWVECMYGGGDLAVGSTHGVSGRTGGRRSERPVSRLFDIAYVGALNRQVRVTSVTAFQRLTGTRGVGPCEAAQSVSPV